MVPVVPFQVPVNGLLRVDSPLRERVRVRGQATHVVEGRGLYLRDAGGSMFVQTAQPVPLTPAEIDAVICEAYAFVAKRGAGNREHAIARFTEQAHGIGGKQ